MGCGIAIVFVAIQTLVMVVYLGREQPVLTEDQFRAVAAASQGSGVVLFFATLLTAAVCVPLILGIATVFLIGLLLGIAEHWTNSVVVPLAMHALANFVASMETAILANRMAG